MRKGKTIRPARIEGRAVFIIGAVAVVADRVVAVDMCEVDKAAVVVVAVVHADADR